LFVVVRAKADASYEEFEPFTRFLAAFFPQPEPSLRSVLVMLLISNRDAGFAQET